MFEPQNKLFKKCQRIAVIQSMFAIAISPQNYTCGLGQSTKVWKKNLNPKNLKKKVLFKDNYIYKLQRESSNYYN